MNAHPASQRVVGDPSWSSHSIVLQHLKRHGWITCSTQPVQRKQEPASLSFGSSAFLIFSSLSRCPSLQHVLWTQCSQNLSNNLMGFRVNPTSLPLVKMSLRWSSRRFVCLRCHLHSCLHYYIHERERSGSVVECLTRDRGAAGLSFTGVTVLWSLSKTHLS